MFLRPRILPAEPQTTATLTVKTQISGVAARKRVAIVDRQTQELLWHSLVETSGEITRILPIKYASTDYLCVKAYDDDAVYDAVIADYVQTELIP